MTLPNFSFSALTSRRTVLWAGALSSGAALAADTPSEQPNVFGPRSGYSPMVGTFVSELSWMRGAVLRATRDMKPEQLDFLLDAKANRIGALLLHLAATEKLYQLNTFDGIGPNEVFTHPSFKDWTVAINLGDPARESVKGHPLEFYLTALRENREKTLSELRKRDDKWLLTVDEKWPWGPTNNLCKWFHVCEHESHHTGQISLIASRAPGAKAENG